MRLQGEAEPVPVEEWLDVPPAFVGGLPRESEVLEKPYGCEGDAFWRRQHPDLGTSHTNSQGATVAERHQGWQPVLPDTHVITESRYARQRAPWQAWWDCRLPGHCSHRRTTTTNFSGEIPHPVNEVAILPVRAKSSKEPDT